MDFHFKFLALLFVTVLMSCTVTLDEIEPSVRKTIPVNSIQTRDLNTLGSDILNWDSIHFRFLRFESITKDIQNCKVMFISNTKIPDTLKLSFKRLISNTTTPYYCVNNESYASINKFNAPKILSTGVGDLIYDKFSEDSVDLIFDFIQTSNYRLPDNSILKARIKGRLRIPAH